MYKAENNCLDTLGKYNLNCVPGSTSISYATSVSSELGNAFDLNLGASGVDILTVSSFGTGSFAALTISFWMKTSAASGSIFTYGSSVSVKIISSTLSITIGGTNMNVPASPTLTNGAWHLVVFTWSTSTQTFNLYIDGTSTYSFSFTSASAISGGSVLYIGADNPPSFSNRYVGKLDQIIIASRVFELNEIISLYNKQYRCFDVCCLRLQLIFID
jgi:hypothetical protein